MTAAPTVQPGVLRLGLVRTGYEVRTFFRERDAVVFIFAYPIIMLAIFATVFGQDGATVGPPPGIPFAQYFLPGMLATGIMLSSFQNLAIGIAVERDDGGLKRLHGTPLPPAAYFLGKTGEVLVTSLVQTVLLLAAAALFFFQRRLLLFQLIDELGDIRLIHDPASVGVEATSLF